MRKLQKGKVKRMFRTDNPVADFERYDAKQQEELNKLPKCDACGEPIQDDHLFDINGDLFCEECMMEIFKQDTEDYILEG